MVVYDQPGVTVAQLGSDLERCAAKAFNAAPPQITRESVTVRNAGVGYGYGGWYGRGIIDRAWVDIDRNELNRERIRQECLRAAGYGFAQIPRCQMLSARDVTGATRQASVAPGSCAVSVPDLGPVILQGR